MNQVLNVINVRSLGTDGFQCLFNTDRLAALPGLCGVGSDITKVECMDLLNVLADIKTSQGARRLVLESMMWMFSPALIRGLLNLVVGTDAVSRGTGESNTFHVVA